MSCASAQRLWMRTKDAFEREIIKCLFSLERILLLRCQSFFMCLRRLAPCVLLFAEPHADGARRRRTSAAAVVGAVAPAGAARRRRRRGGTLFGAAAPPGVPPARPALRPPAQRLPRPPTPTPRLQCLRRLRAAPRSVTLNKLFFLALFSLLSKLTFLHYGFGAKILNFCNLIPFLFDLCTFFLFMYIFVKTQAEWSISRIFLRLLPRSKLVIFSLS